MKLPVDSWQKCNRAPIFREFLKISYENMKYPRLFVYLKIVTSHRERGCTAEVVVGLNLEHLLNIQALPTLYRNIKFHTEVLDKK